MPFPSMVMDATMVTLTPISNPKFSRIEERCLICSPNCLCMTCTHCIPVADNPKPTTAVILSNQPAPLAKASPDRRSSRRLGLEGRRRVSRSKEIVVQAKQFYVEVEDWITKNHP